MNTRLRISRTAVRIVVTLAVLAIAGAVWYVGGPRSQAAADRYAAGRELLDDVVRKVQTTYIKRDVTDDQLYAGATKGLLAAVGNACAKLVAPPTPAATGTREKFYALVPRVEAQCPSAPRTNALFFSAAKGMLDSLGDQYTRLMEPEAYRMFVQDTQGFFFGIGIYIDVKGGYPIVVQPLPNTPAHRAGLRAGDRIIVVDGVSTKDMALQEAVTRIRGPEGTPVRLRLQRGDREFDVSIVRARIRLIAAEGPEALPEAARAELAAAKIGYIHLVTFNHERAAQEFDRFLSEARRSGARALILDLRNNGGGLLDQSIEIGGRFLPAGAPILHIYDRNGKQETARASRGGKVNLPTVLLVNEFSASASEIVAGALQDNGAATLVGVHTFGKNLIQSVLDLPLKAGAVITSAKWLTPKGQDISHKGLTPNVVVGETEETLRARLKGRPDAEIDKRVDEMHAQQLSRAVEILKRKLRGAVGQAA